MQTLLWFALCCGLMDDETNRHLFPSKANMVMHVDLAAVREAKIFNEDMQKAFKFLVTENEQVKKLAQLLNFDPEKQISGFTICGVGEGREGNALMIVNGEFPYEELGKQLARMSEDGELTSMSINDLPVYFNHRARQAVYFAVVDGATAIASSSKRILEDAVQGLTDLRQPSTEILDRLEWANDEDEGPPAMTIAGVFPREAKENMARIPQLAPFAQQLEGYNFAFRFGEPNKFMARLSMTDENAAKTAAGTFKLFMGLGMAAMRNQNQRPDILEMMEKIKISDKGKDLVFEGDFPTSLMETFAANNRRDQARFEERQRERMAERKNGVQFPFERKNREAKKKSGDGP